MPCSRKEIKSTRFIDEVTKGSEDFHVASEGSGVTRDVDDVPGSHLGGGLYGDGVETFAGRIDDDHVGVFPLVRKTGGGLGCVRAVEVGIFDTVAGGVFAGILDGFGNDLNAGDMPCLPGECEGDRTRAAAQIKHGLGTGQRGKLKDAGIQPLGLVVVHLIEGMKSEAKRS